MLEMVILIFESHDLIKLTMSFRLIIHIDRRLCLLVNNSDFEASLLLLKFINPSVVLLNLILSDLDLIALFLDLLGQSLLLQLILLLNLIDVSVL